MGRGQRVHHLLHVFVGILTRGRWWVVGLILALTGGEQRVTLSRPPEIPAGTPGRRAEGPSPCRRRHLRMTHSRLYHEVRTEFGTTPSAS